MRIADTSAQDVKLAPKGNRTRNLVGGGSILAVLVALWVAIPALNRWSSTSASVPYERLRIAEVITLDMKVDEDKPVAFRARVKLSFKLLSD